MRKAKTGNEFLTYLRTIYLDAPADSKGGQLWQSANALLYPNGQPQVALVGYYVMDEAVAYNKLLGDKIDLKDLAKLITQVSLCEMRDLKDVMDDVARVKKV